MLSTIRHHTIMVILGTYNRLYGSIAFGLVVSAIWMAAVSAGCSSPDANAPELDAHHSVIADLSEATNEIEYQSLTPPSVAPSPGASSLESAATSGLVAGDDLASLSVEHTDGGAVRVEIPSAFIPDPAVVGFPHDHLLHGEIYAGLTTISDDPNVVFELDLAESMEVTDAGRTYRFLLRKGLKFSDGSPLGASDVKWSWERSLAMNQQTGQAREIFGAIRGSGVATRNDSANLEGVEVIDDRTLIVMLDRPVAHFPALLAHPLASVLSPQNVANWGFNWSRWRLPEYSDTDPYVFQELPVGAGPFKIVFFDFVGDIVILERNPHYWRGAPRLDRIEFVGFDYDSDKDLIESLKQRDFDFTVAPGATNSLRIEQSQENEYGKVQSDEFRTQVALMVFNDRIEPFDDPQFRTALAITAKCRVQSWFTSLESEHAMASTPVGSYSYVMPRGILPPDNLGFDIDRELDLTECHQAKEELVGSRFNSDFELVFRWDKSYDPAQVKHIVDGWKEELNINVAFKSVDDQLMHLKMVDAGFVPVHRVVVTPFYPDPNSILSVFGRLFQSAEARTPIQHKVIEMLNAAEAEQDSATRLERYRELASYLEESAIAVPISWSEGRINVRYQPWLNGYLPPAYHGSRFKDVWIDSDHPDYFEIAPIR